MSQFKNVQLPFALFLLFLFAALFLNTALAEDGMTNNTQTVNTAPVDNSLSPPTVNAGNAPSYQSTTPVNNPPPNPAANPAPAPAVMPATAAPAATNQNSNAAPAFGTTNNTDVSSVISYQAKNVDAGQIAATLQSLYGNQISVVTQQQQIMIRGNPSQLAEIQGIIATLDVAPRQLLISIRQNVSLNDLKNVYHVGGAGGQLSSETVTQSYGTNDRSPQGSQAEVQALEGQPARIALTQSVPLITGAGNYPVWGPGGYGGAGGPGGGGGRPQPNNAAGGFVSYSYANLMTGFDVIAHIVNNTALLDISTFSGNTVPNTFQNTSTSDQHTTMRVPLGQWALLGGTGVLDDNGTLMDSYGTGGRNNQANSATIIRVTLVGS